jgi:hypothetical protein
MWEPACGRTGLQRRTAGVLDRRHTDPDYPRPSRSSTDFSSSGNGALST